MDYKLEWSIPKRVILLKVSGDVSLEELRQFNADMTQYLNEGTPYVHLISVGTNIRRVPTNLIQIKETITYVHHPHMGWTIIVQEKPNPLTGFMIAVATQATGMKLRHIKTLNDGLETLRRIDTSLNDDSRL